jgi:hypothetical protein
MWTPVSTQLAAATKLVGLLPPSALLAAAGANPVGEEDTTDAVSSVRSHVASFSLSAINKALSALRAALASRFAAVPIREWTPQYVTRVLAAYENDRRHRQSEGEAREEQEDVCLPA